MCVSTDNNIGVEGANALCHCLPSLNIRFWCTRRLCKLSAGVMLLFSFLCFCLESFSQSFVFRNFRLHFLSYLEFVCLWVCVGGLWVFVTVIEGYHIHDFPKPSPLWLHWDFGFKIITKTEKHVDRVRSLGFTIVLSVFAFDDGGLGLSPLQAWQLLNTSNHVTF